MPRLTGSNEKKQHQQHQGLQFLKQHGQHILKNPLVIQNIIEKANIKSTDVVLEIGPGTGNMTVQLLKKAKQVIAVEIDPRMVVELQKRVQGTPELQKKLQIIHGDILKVKLPFFNLCIANVPYQISSGIVFKLLAHRPVFRCAFLMFQREFAMRLVAQPGTPFYCRLSANTQLLSKCEHIMKVHKNSFRPPPKVDSSIVRIEPFHPPPQINFTEWDGLSKIVFGRKNKKMRGLFTAKSTLESFVSNYKTYCALKNEKMNPEFEKSPMEWMKSTVDTVLLATELNEVRANTISTHQMLKLLAAFNATGIHFTT